MDESCIYWREVVHRRRQGCEDGGKPQGAAEYLVPFHVFLHVFDGPHPAPGEARGERAETCGRWGVRPMLSRWKKTVRFCGSARYGTKCARLSTKRRS